MKNFKPAKPQTTDKDWNMTETNLRVKEEEFTKEKVNSITENHVQSVIADEKDLQIGKTTVIWIKLKNGFEVVGTSACVDPKNYNHEIGKKYARDRAISKIWELEAYKLQYDLN